MADTILPPIPAERAPAPVRRKIVPPQRVQAGFPFAAVSVLITVLAAILLYRIPTPAIAWSQNYNPIGFWWLSTILAAMPIVVLLGSLAVLRMKAHHSALC